MQCDELIEELSRVKSENKRLTDLLTTLSRNLSEFKHMQLEEEEELSRTKKRKAQDNENLQINLSNNTMPNVIRSNISRVYVRIDPSDVSLVSSYILQTFYFLFFLKGEMTYMKIIY